MLPNRLEKRTVRKTSHLGTFLEVCSERIFYFFGSGVLFGGEMAAGRSPEVHKYDQLLPAGRLPPVPVRVRFPGKSRVRNVEDFLDAPKSVGKTFCGQN